MKKYLFSALALPLLFACSTDDFEKPVASNDPYPGIEKVNATFYMDEEPLTRMDNGTGWTLAAGDLYGFAWMGNTAPNEQAGPKKVVIDGNAYQNHNLIQKDGMFEPQTSIYVGKYYIYRPYDDTTVSPDAIKFNSLIEQPLAEGQESGFGTDVVTPWKKLAETAIIIADKWTDINTTGRTYNPNNVNEFEDGGDWDLPGIKQPYKVFAAFFSNQTGLDLKYSNNNPVFGNAGQAVKGATDIDYTETGSAGAADIYGATVKLTGAAHSFTYAPTASPNGEQHDGAFWTDKKASQIQGFTFANGNGYDVITLNAPVNDEGEIQAIGTGNEGSKGWFWFNSLPVTGQDAATANTPIVATVKTSYGTVTIDKNSQAGALTIGDCAWVFEDPTGKPWNHNQYSPEWMKLVANMDAQDLTLPVGQKKWSIVGTNEVPHNTFVNQFGNHKGKYVLDVDFSTAVMDIHITNDEHLQKYLKFYLASGKNNGANLVLDGKSATDNTFYLSKISIALLQTINATAGDGKKVLVAPCRLHAHNAPNDGRVKIVVTQDGQADATLRAVPTLYDVFATKAVFENDEEDVAPVPVYLSENCTWTWGDNIVTNVGGVDVPGMLKIDGQVASITNEGTLNVTNTNVQLSEAYQAAVPAQQQQEAQDAKYYLVNAAGAEMNIENITTVKNPLTNFGTINVKAGKELRAYGVAITNDATELDAYGTINNWGVVGVTYNIPNGEFNNYGLIDMKSENAMTLLTRNQTPTGNDQNNPISTFKKAFNAENNKLGTVILPENDPFAIVSVSNAPETGFVKYRWNGGATYATPEKPGGIVKYNTVIVSSDIEIAEVEPEIQYIEFDSENLIHFTNPQNADPKYLGNLRGIIVTDGTKLLIEKTNEITCKESAYLGEGATIYNGGVFTDNATKVGTDATNYLGGWSTDQVVVYGN